MGLHVPHGTSTISVGNEDGNNERPVQLRLSVLGKSKCEVMAAPPPPGVYVPVPTFFVSRQASTYSPQAPPLDLETQAKHAIHLAKCGIRGLVVLGSTGEAIAITNKERAELLRHVRQQLEIAGYKDYPIVAVRLCRAYFSISCSTYECLKHVPGAACPNAYPRMEMLTPIR